LYLVLALAGNKNDMYEHEEVEENEGKELAKDLGAIFQKTSAKESTGVEDLFIKIGKKFLNPNATTSSGGAPSSGKAEIKEKGQKLKADSGKKKGDKNGCC
jgi:Fe2+ transport system protein B